MIDCVSIATNHNFKGNPLLGQHQLRYREVIQKEEWGNIYTVDGMEFDQYDNLATEYYIARNANGDVLGITRSYPTTIPYMLSEAFKFLITQDLPSSPKVVEASRLVLDRTLLSKEQRQPVIDQLIVAYMERGLQRGIDCYVGFMLPKIWSSTFVRAGWDVRWLGPEILLPGTTDIVRAALMPVSEEMNDKVRKTTGIHEAVLNFGEGPNPGTASIASYSHMSREIRRVA
jgi:acyl-homoserine lactone synthase